MNDIKSKLVNAANHQQINNINKEDIINKIDKSKVKEVESPRRRFNFVPVLAASVFLAFAAGFVAIGIKVNLDNSYKKEYSILDVDEEDIDNGEEVFDDLDKIETKELLNQISNQAVYNIINIADTLPNIKFDEVLDDASNKNLTPALEKALVADINYYIHNIEDMLEYTNTVCVGEINKDTAYDYHNKITVTSPYYEYYIYYNEVIFEEENVDLDNYKSKSNINGVIVCGAYNYSFETLKIIKNSAIDYNTKIIINENDYVIVDEKFSKDLNIFQYNYFVNNVEKDININQSLTADGTTKQIGFNSNDKLFQAVITKKDENTINCKLKKRNSDVLTITLEEENYRYEFKNSNNQYVEEK